MIAAIYYFKPQTIAVSTVFLAVISYILGEFMAFIIPKHGWIGRWFNPHPFNAKEHIAIIIMANAASTCALGIELLAVERLYYNTTLNGGLSIFLLFSSQFLGYGITGLLRKTLVYPETMLWPSNLPVNTMLETLHRKRSENKRGLKVFGIVFACIFVWEIVPQWIMPLLTGISIFCLAGQNNAAFTNVFGGASGNEGLGLFSWCMDWQYISGGYSPLYYPLDSLISQGIGVVICICLFSGVFYTNLWNAQNFPFLSQVLFSQDSNSTDPIQWNQTAVIGADNLIDKAALDVYGLPWFSTTYALATLLVNMSITASITHLLLYKWNEMKMAWAFFNLNNLKSLVSPKTWNIKFWNSDASPDEDQTNYDPHYRMMLAYKACPDWWYGLVLILSVIIALVCLYKGDSTLPWWGYLVACLMAYVCIVFFAAQQAVTGVVFLIQPVVQMVGGYIQPGNPVANMYFTLYGYNSVLQGTLLGKDLKLAQYGHLAPRVTFTMQMLGTFIGAIFNYIMMNQIVTNQRDILLSVEGTNVWSGQQPQQYNSQVCPTSFILFAVRPVTNKSSQAVAWGGLAHDLFSVGGRYEWTTLVFLLGFIAPLPFYLAHRLYPKLGFDGINTGVIIYYAEYLCVGINSSIMAFFAIGFTSQFYIRRYYPNIFLKYNYLVSAALDGGTSVIVFILSFAVEGAAGNAINFPEYWGNNANGNFDRCLYTSGGS